MTLIGIVLVLIIAGLVLWLINTYIPMAAAIKSLLNVVVFIVFADLGTPGFWPDRQHPRHQDAGPQIAAL